MEQEPKTPRERAEDLISLLVADWRPTTRQGLWAIRIGIVLGLLVAIGYSYGITLWDWAQLLFVPAVLAAGGLWFNQQQQERQREDARQQQERELALAERRSQDEALQAYLDQMANMLIPNKDQPSLYKARPGDSLSSVARARTLTVLPRLGGDRKARVVQFLLESGLIAKNQPVLVLARADLSNAYLSHADLSNAYLSHADLSNAYMGGAYLTWAHLIGADLSNAYMVGAVLSGAKLSWAKLSEAVLRGAYLTWADLTGADLTGADLTGADLSWADLSSVKGPTNAQLLEQAWSLEGATMPNGQKYEDWLKSKGSREDGENDGFP